jgi:hypothetical protein
MPTRLAIAHRIDRPFSGYRWTRWACLKGHYLCPNPEHYMARQVKAVKVAKPELVKCQDGQGNPILDAEGKQAFVKVYRLLTSHIVIESPCRLYDAKAESQIAVWKAEDRQQRQAERRIERKQLHTLGERRLPLRGQFSTIAQDIFFGSQPSHYLEGLGISGLTFQPFAKVRVSSSYIRLYVDLGDTLKGLSKTKRRKAIRYGKALPVSIQRQIDLLCSLAVRHYLNKG